MPVVVRIPTPLRALTGGEAIVKVEASTVDEAIDRLDASYPGIAERVRGEDGELHRFVNVFVNESDVRFLDGAQTELADGDEVSIIPAMAGGAPRS